MEVICPAVLLPGHSYYTTLQMLLFYVLAKPEAISGWAPICDSVHSRQLYGAAPLVSQATSAMT